MIDYSSYNLGQRSTFKTNKILDRLRTEKDSSKEEAREPILFYTHEQKSQRSDSTKAKSSRESAVDERKSGEPNPRTGGDHKPAERDKRR